MTFGTKYLSSAGPDVHYFLNSLAWVIGAGVGALVASIIQKPDDVDCLPFATCHPHCGGSSSPIWVASIWTFDFPDLAHQPKDTGLSLYGSDSVGEVCSEVLRL